MAAPYTSLDLIQIASPCPALWDEMAGDERVRFCKLCKLNVYNLSEMTREEAVAFIGRHIAGQASSVTQRADRQANNGIQRMCVRLYRRADGTVLTKDCPVGLGVLRQRVVRAAAALAGLVLAMVGGTLFGGSASRLLPGPFKSPVRAFANWVEPEPVWDVNGPALLGGPWISPPTPPLADNSRAVEPAETPLLPLTRLFSV